MKKISKLALNELQGEKMPKQHTKLIVGGYDGVDDPWYFIDGCCGNGCLPVYLDGQYIIGCTSFVAHHSHFCCYGK